MDSLDSTGLDILCRRLLEQFVSQNGQDSVPLPFDSSLSEIGQIVVKNLKAGRLDRHNKLRAPSEQLTEDAYVSRVISIWCKEQPDWCLLRSGDEAKWRWLEKDLTRAAKQLLGQRHQTGSDAFTFEDYVQRTVLNILRYGYHFDMPLMVWARAILKNTIREPDRSRDALDQWHFTLDMPIVLSSARNEQASEIGYIDHTTEERLEQIQAREDLVVNLAKLTELRQAVLILDFFQELSDPEIAKKLDISLSHLYSTRHRALKQLCELMEDYRSMQE